jgi:peptide chain release factor 1
MNINDQKQQTKELEEEISKLEKESINPKVIKDSRRIKQISQELSQKREKLSILKELTRVRAQLSDAQEILAEESDEDMKALAEEEVQKLGKSKKDLEDRLNRPQEAKLAHEMNDCILEIRAGTGGEESNLFASDLFRMYAKYAESKGWKVAILSRHQTGTGGFKEIITQIQGEGAYSRLMFENGVHRVQRVPVTESSGRIHTSAVSVVVYPLLEQSEIDIDPNDLKIDVYRSGGPGGQSVNTTDSAVRITHIPTGAIVTCQDEKSQHKNKKKALSILSSRLADMEAQEQQEEVDEIRRSAIKTGDRSAKVRTYNFPQNRITDHRIKKSWHNLKVVLDGNLDQVIETLREQL